jgi:hypothetical protein
LNKSDVQAFVSSIGAIPFGSRASWTSPADPDIAYYEYKATLTDSDSAVDYSWSTLKTTKELFVDLYNFSIQQGFFRVRAVDKSGNAGPWAAATGNLNSMTYIRRASGNMAGQDSNDVSTSGISTGQSGSPTKVLARHSGYTTKTFSGGSPAETFDISLSGLGFSTSPDGGSVQCNNVNLKAGYNKGDPASTSTNARCFVATLDGTNIPSGTYGFNFIFEED